MKATKAVHLKLYTTEEVLGSIGGGGTDHANSVFMTSAKYLEIWRPSPVSIHEKSNRLFSQKTGDKTPFLWMSQVKN